MARRKRRKVNVEPTKEELEAMLAKLNAENATMGYEPTMTQKLFMYDAARYKMLTGGNRTGKTAHCAYELAACLQNIHPTKSVKSTKGTYLILAPSLEQISDPWEKKLLKQSELEGAYKNKPLIPKHEIKKVHYSQSSSGKVMRGVEMKSGHELLAMPSGDPNVWKRIQGKKILGVCLDENIGNIALLQEVILRLLDANSDPDIVREAGGGWILWGATDTVYNEGFEWFKERCDKEDEDDFAMYHLVSDENPAIKAEEREKLRSVLGEEQAAIRLDGTGSSLGIVSIYGEQWDDNKHISQTPIHIRPEDNLWISLDPGVDHPTGILYASVGPSLPQQLRIHRFDNFRRKSVDYALELMAEWLEGRWLEGLVLDQASKRTEMGGNSVAGQIRERLDSFGIKSRRGVLFGFNRHEQGIARCRRMLTAGNLLVDKNGEGCSLFAYQMRKYRGRPETNFTGPQGVIKKEDEGPDTVRYLESKYGGWVERPPNLPQGKFIPTLKDLVAHPEMEPEEIDPVEAAHIARLRASAQMMSRIRPKRGGQIGRGHLGI